MLRFLVTLFMCCLPKVVLAQQPIVIFGSAAQKDGGQNEALEMLPQSSQNMPDPKSEQMPAPMVKKAVSELSKKKIEPKMIEQLSPQDPPPFSIPPQVEKNKIENTLYESGDRIYDIQSYPLKDINIITEPNVDPTISTFPEY